MIVVIPAIALLALTGVIGWRILKTRDSPSSERNQSASSSAISASNDRTLIKLKTEGGCAVSDIKCGTYIFEGTEYTALREGSEPLKGTLPNDIAADLAAGARQRPDQVGTKATCISFVDDIDYTAEVGYEDVVTTHSTCYTNQDPRDNGDPAKKYRYSYSSKLLEALDRALAYIHQTKTRN